MGSREFLYFLFISGIISISANNNYTLTIKFFRNANGYNGRYKLFGCTIIVVIVAVILPLFFIFGCGNVGGSAKKVGLRIKELDRLYGIKNGGSGFYGNQHGKNEELTNNFTAPQKTEKDIADMMGISRQQLQNYKKLTEMIPELEELLDTGIVSQIPMNILTMYIKSNNIDV